MVESDDFEPNQTLTRGIQILETFDPDHPDWGVRELARKLAIHPTTIFRLMQTLCRKGYLKQNASTQRYSLGSRIMKLAAVYSQHNPLPRVARQVFERHAHRFEYNFALGVLNQYEVIYLAVFDASGPLKVRVEPGRSIPLHTTALGKVLLAFQNEAYIRGFLDNTVLCAYTSRSIPDPDMLWQELTDVRKRGYSLNHGELYEDIGAIAVPVRTHRGNLLAGVSLGFPLHLLQERRLQAEGLVNIAFEIAEEITQGAGMMAL